MIYFWPTTDGDFTMVTDAEDREIARLWALDEGMSAADTLGCMLDSTQMAARKAGLFTNDWDRGGDGRGAIFPNGPFCVPAPPSGPLEETVIHVRENWQPARIVVRPDGPHCSPLPPGQPGRVERAGPRRRAR